MRKILLFSLVLILSLQLAQAQSSGHFKPFKVNIGLGNTLESKGARSPISMGYLEPGYSFGQTKIGIRVEAAGLYMKTISSGLLTADHYFTKDYDFRPFIGGGLGSYASSESGGCGGGYGKTYHSTKPFGGMLRAGFESEHVRIAVEYNFVADTYVRYYDESGKLSSTSTYPSGYFGLKVGINIGGGYGKNNQLSLKPICPAALNTYGCSIRRPYIKE